MSSNDRPAVPLIEPLRLPRFSEEQWRVFDKFRSAKKALDDLDKLIEEGQKQLQYVHEERNRRDDPTYCPRGFDEEDTSYWLRRQMEEREPLSERVAELRARCWRREIDADRTLKDVLEYEADRRTVRRVAQYREDLEELAEDVRAQSSRDRRGRE